MDQVGSGDSVTILTLTSLHTSASSGFDRSMVGVASSSSTPASGGGGGGGSRSTSQSKRLLSMIGRAFFCRLVGRVAVAVRGRDAVAAKDCSSTASTFEAINSTTPEAWKYAMIA